MHGSRPIPSAAPTSGARLAPPLPRSARVAALLLPAILAACSPVYVIKAGIEQAKIMAARRPIPEVILDPGTDETTRGKLTLALEARAFARDSLGLDVGDSYTTFVRLDSDTLAMVLSAAPRDRLVNHTWWFPIVGRMPYKGFFSLDDALEAQRDLEEDGMDTYLRPTAAFSTLGWFADPLLSTLLRQDEVELVETIFHEMAHSHLWVPGQVTFNESWATFVGRAGAAAFFCGREGGGPDTLKCQRAQARWRDYQRFSAFMDVLVEELRVVYDDPSLSFEAKLERRAAVFATALERFQQEVRPTFESVGFGGFASTPLNNATLLARLRYYHRLADFQAYLEDHGGDLSRAVTALEAGVDGVQDPFELLRSGSAPPAAPSSPPP